MSIFTRAAMRSDLFRTGIIIACVAFSGFLGSAVTHTLDTRNHPIVRIQARHLPTATATPNLQVVARFQGAGSGNVGQFYTPANWVLVWTCDPTVDGVVTSYPLVLTDSNPDPYDLAPPTNVSTALQVVCQPGQTSGRIGVFETGEQDLSVLTTDQLATDYTGQPNAPWTFTVEIAP